MSAPEPGGPASGEARRARQAGSFGAAAEVYERARPGYPEPALDWLLPSAARTVLDLGAGTGKLTRQLVARGLEVIAVEPSDGMRAELQRVLPGITALAGTGELIPLADGSVDVVLAAQAWHWVDPARAAPEVARVLRPGGRLGMVWNRRDGSVDWLAELGRIMEGGVDHMDSADPVVGPPFGRIERFDVPWRQSMTPEGLVELAASRSYVITATEADRQAILERVAELTRTHPALARHEEFALPYVTNCSRTELAPVA